MLLTIADQGKGMDSNATHDDEPARGKSAGVGVAGMRERVLQLGGRFEILPGHPGTIIKATFPVPEGNASESDLRYDRS